MARQLRTQLEQEVHFDPLATGNSTPSRPAAGHGTIHTPPTPTAGPSEADAAPRATTDPAEPPDAVPPSADTHQTDPDERKPG